MQPTHVICFIAGAITVLVIFFLMDVLRRKTGERGTSSPVATGRKPSAPLRPAGEVPYGVDQRPMPTGDDLDVLLPSQVGSFVRGLNRVPKDIHNNPIYADYRQGGLSVFVELGICGEPSGAQQAIRTAKAETDAEFPDIPQEGVLGTDPSYLRTVNRLGAFFAWTRGSYYFSAHAKGGKADLDVFMKAFPY
jgi:hypothetical protein